MANDNGLTDPFVVKYDSANGIATNGDDARYGLGGLTQGLPGAAFGFGTGVYPSGYDSSGITDLRVQAQSSPNMTVLMLYGNYVTGRTGHGAYYGAVTASQTITIAANSAGNPRYDLVVLRTRDGGISTDGTVTKSAFPYVVQGTAAATPTEPTAGDGDVACARVLVRAGTSSILASDVADRRIYQTATGGITPLSSSDTRLGGYPGQYRDNNGQLERFDGTSWVAVASPSTWSNYTPQLYYGGDGLFAGGSTACNFGNGATTFCRYQVTGKKMEFNYSFNWGTAPYYFGTGPLNTLLPTGYRHRNFNGESHVFAKLFVNDSVSGATGNYLGGAFLRQNSNILWFEFPIDPTNNNTSYYQVAASSGVTGGGVPQIPNGFPQGGILTCTGTIEIA